MKTAHRRVLAAAATLALLVGGTGCGDEPKTFKVSGDCALGEEDYLPLSSILPEKTIRHLVGVGEYTTIAGLIVKNGKLPAAYDGHCHLTDLDDGQYVLELGTVNAKDPRYTEAQELLASGDFDGFRRLDSTTYEIPLSGEHDGVKVVRVLPERIIIFSLVRPAQGVDAAEESGPAMDRITDYFQARQGAWDAP